MGFDSSLVTLLGLQLILKTFQSRHEEKLEERLKTKSNEDIAKILLSKTIAATKKEISLIKEKRKTFINQVSKNLKVYHLGQNTTYDSVPDLLTSLIQRDYPYVETFDGTKTLKIFIPEVFLIKHPKIISESGYLRLKSALENGDSKKLKEFEGKYRELKGHIVEKLCYDDIKKYFNKRNESVLVIHGLCMLRPDSKKGQMGSEKDFIIVNYTYSYIMTIEVKLNLTIDGDKNATVEKSANQLKEAFEILEEIFGEDIKGSWRFIPMVYCSTMDKEVGIFLKDKYNFIFCRSDERSFASKMDQLLKNLKKRQEILGLKTPEIFKTIAKHLIFAVSSIELPVKGSIINKMRKLREEAGSYENICLWLFLNPAQQTILNSEVLEKVILTGTYSVGKTTVLFGRALKLNDKGENVLFVNATGIRDQGIVKTLMSLQFEEQFKDKPKISFKTFSNLTIRTGLLKAMTEPKKNQYKNHHLIIDEYILQTKDRKATDEEIQETRQLFENLTAIFKSVWICLSRGYLSTSLFDNDYEANFDLIESWFPN